MSFARAHVIRAEFDTNLKQEWKQRPRCEDPDHHGHPMCPCRQRIFYHTPKLENWMMKKEHDQKTRLEHLMNSLKIDSPPGSKYFTPKSLIEDSHHKYILLFSCLLKSGEERWLYFFRKAGYADSNLRELGDGEKRRRSKLETDLRNFGETELSINSITDIFDAEKWAFCPVDFNDESKLSNGELSFHNGCILPFCARRTVKTGGTASVSAVIVQEDFVGKSIRRSLGKPYTDKDFGPCYEFAIKTYDARTRAEIFFNERQAFDGLVEVDGVVRFFGSYSVTTGETESHNIILELGKMDLFESYLENEPPQRTKEIIANWKSIANVAKAIRYIHEIRQPSGHSTYGIHGDIKPDNILLVGNELKLADFGFAFFFVKDENSGMNAPEKLLGHTRSYGPPEDRPSDKIDMWSFGCVLSMNATWIVAGEAGVDDYVELRLQSKKVSKREHPTDTFHDGVSVLPQISKWHEYLKSIVRKSDSITPRILDVIRDKLFQTKPEMRVDATKLCEILDSIIEQEEKKLAAQELADQETDAQIDDDVVKALLVGDYRRQGSSSSDQEVNPNHVIQVTGPGEQMLQTKAAGSGLRPPHGRNTRKLSRPRPSISQRQATLASSHGVKIEMVLPGAESGASHAETSGSVSRALGASQVPVPRPLTPDGSYPGVASQSHISSQNTKGKGKEVVSSEADDLPESHRNQQLAITTVLEHHTPTRSPLLGEGTLGTISVTHIPTTPPHPVPDPIVAQPDEAETGSMSHVSKRTTNASRRRPQGQTDIMRLAFLGDVPWVQACLEEEDVDISLKDDEGKTVLHHLVSSLTAKMKVSTELSTLIADIEKRDPTLFNTLDASGRSPLYLSGQNLELVKTLANSGARVDKLTFITAIETELDKGVSGLVDFYLKHEIGDNWIDDNLKDRIKKSKRLRQILLKSEPRGSRNSQRRSILSLGRKDR